MKHEIHFDESVCVGCGLCESLCENWTMTPDGKATFKKKIIIDSELESNRVAADNCPTQAIKLNKLK